MGKEESPLFNISHQRSVSFNLSSSRVYIELSPYIFQFQNTAKLRTNEQESKNAKTLFASCAYLEIMKVAPKTTRTANSLFI